MYKAIQITCFWLYLDNSSTRHKKKIMRKYFSVFLMLTLLTSFTRAQESTIGPTFFAEVDLLMSTYVQEGKVNYTELKKDPNLNDLIQQVGKANVSGLDEQTQKAFYINAYNLSVIKGVVDIYPTTSVQKTPGFFNTLKRSIINEQITLNDFEKQYLLDKFKDPRLHFVLVCGAVGCPPIINQAYKPENLESQLDQQTRLALNNNEFIKSTEETVALNQIFEWYLQDFGGNKNSAVTFINQYRDLPINLDLRVTYYGYDWRLNDISKNNLQATNAARYIVSAAIPEKTSEVKIFNNLYSQRTGDNGELTNRSTFFTTLVSAIYGITNRFNLGFELRYRRVYNSMLPNSPFSVFGSHDPVNFRQGVTTIGPRIRFAPFPKLRNFSIQSTLAFPIGKDLAGTSNSPYIDWNGVSFNNQLFNDIPLGNKFSLFTELDLFLEDIGPSEDNHANRFSTPVTAIASYFPNPKTTIYVLSGFSPYWQSTFDYFVQGGLGAKYQFTPNFELELLYTGFTNKFLAETDGKAATYNFGIRSNF